MKFVRSCLRLTSYLFGLVAALFLLGVGVLGLSTGDEIRFDLVPGVIRTISGYTGGMLKDPTYRQVSAGNFGHIKSVRIYFDPKKTS